MFAIGTVGQAAAIWIVCGGVRTVGGWLDESWDDVKSDGRAAAHGTVTIDLAPVSMVSAKGLQGGASAKAADVSLSRRPSTHLRADQKACLSSVGASLLGDLGGHTARNQAVR